MANTTTTTDNNNNNNSTNTNTNTQSTPHLGTSRQYWRDMILGVNDGLVSTFLLVAGVAGGRMTVPQILLTSLAGALAGAISMSAGEYVATKSQNQVLQGELALERLHIREHLDEEIAELSALLKLIGIESDSEYNPEETDTAVTTTPSDIVDGRSININNTNIHTYLMEYYRQNEDALLKIMTTLEFGVLEREERSPVVAALVSGLLFVLGALPSVIPFIFAPKPITGLVAATITTVTSLLFVGAVKTWATRAKCWQSSLENLIIAGFGGLLAYGVGALFDMWVNSPEEDPL